MNECDGFLATTPSRHPRSLPRPHRSSSSLDSIQTDATPTARRSSSRSNGIFRSVPATLRGGELGADVCALTSTPTRVAVHRQGSLAYGRAGGVRSRSNGAPSAARG